MTPGIQIITITPEIIYGCPFCSSKFYIWSDLKQHVKRCIDRPWNYKIKLKRRLRV